jgi:small subunit ribosomal protein S6
MTVFDGTLSDTELQHEVDGVKKLIDADGEIERVDEWGRRQLACTIKKRTSGYYVLFLYQGETSLPSKMSRTFKLNDRMLRHLTVVRDLRAEAAAKARTARIRAERAAAEEATQAAAKTGEQTKANEQTDETKGAQKE